MAAFVMWIVEMTAELINLYEEALCLCDTREDEYHNKLKRNVAIQEIAKQMETTG